MVQSLLVLFLQAPLYSLSSPVWRHLPASQLRPIHLYLVYVFLVIGAVSGLSLLVRRSALEGGLSRYEAETQQAPTIPNTQPIGSAEVATKITTHQSG
jgi:hypothetical protein